QPNIKVYSTGLGDGHGEFTLYIPSYNGYVYEGLASFKRDAAEGWLPCAIYGFKKSKHSIYEVQCKSEMLDSFRLAPDFLKIDVQGWEYNVLIGARKTLAQHEPVLLIEIYDDPRIDALLRDYGYREYFLDKGRLAPGRGPDPLNLLFVTERRIGPMVDRCTKADTDTRFATAPQLRNVALARREDFARVLCLRGYDIPGAHVRPSDPRPWH